MKGIRARHKTATIRPFSHSERFGGVCVDILEEKLLYLIWLIGDE